MARSKQRDLRDVVPMARHALANGGQITRPGVVEWEVYGSCSNPQYVEHYATKHSTIWLEKTGTFVWRRPGDRPILVEMRVKCRKCPECLRARAVEWRERARVELARSARTWFGTLTLSPEAHSLIMMRAWRRLRRTGVVWETLAEAEQLQERHIEASAEISRWLKRVRKNSQSPLRYLLVMEAHKTGLPHYHMLMHEVHTNQPVRHRQLTDAWRLGFTNFKLVDPTDFRAAYYVCKYLAKSSRARVRASLDYGKTHEVHSEVETISPEKQRGESSREHPPPRGSETTQD